MIIEAISEVAEGVSHGAHGGDGLATDLRNYGVVDVGRGVAEFHFDEFERFFNTTAGAVGWGGTRRRISAHVSSSNSECRQAASFPVWRMGQVASMLDALKVPQRTIRALSTKVPMGAGESRGAGSGINGGDLSGRIFVRVYMVERESGSCPWKVGRWCGEEGRQLERFHN